MPREITHHSQILEAIGSVDSISELVERENGHFKYELDLEVVVYGRNYTGKKVGPYARLLVYTPGEEVITQGDWGGNTLYLLVEGVLDVYVTDERATTPRKVAELQPGVTFGERSVLAGQPRNATVTVPPETEATVIEIQRPALRLLRKLKKFGHTLDVAYRKYGLDHTLLEVEEATEDAFSPELLKQLGDAARFTVYGKNHILFQEGDPLNRLVFVKNGWVRRTRGLAANPTQADKVMELGKDVGIDFLGAGNCLGLEALSEDGKSNWKYTATVMARTEVLEVAVSRLRANPALRERVLKYFDAFSKVDDRPPEPPLDKRVVAAAGREITTGIVDATNLLVMDMDLCIRCGNCSLACHKVHGQSRLLRRGIHIARPVKPESRSTQHVLAPAVCLHCQDPECLTGCPTGAIGRFSEGEIDINPKTCIGCGDCATQCPYNAISMIPRKPTRPEASSIVGRLRSWFSLAQPKLPPAVTEVENLLAVKCNLCNNTPLNPPGAKKDAYSCQENCPTGALVRVNPREYFNEAKNAIGIVFKDQTHAIGRNIHKRDIPAKLWHIFGVLATVAITWALIWAARRYTLDGHLAGTWLTVRWITGLIGLGGIAIVMTYPARKQIYRRRAGPLRYWLLSHVYIGLIAGIVLLLHGGRETGGLLTSVLMVSFDLVIVSGLFGIACYIFVPRIMTSIEGDPLLIEDLRDRREELRDTLAQIDLSNVELRKILERKIRKRFLSFRYLLRQYVRREELTTMLADAREEFREDAAALTDPQARRLLMDVVEATATLRRVDSLIYLHQLLKLWLAPHVVSSSIMLALMVVHIVQVIFFTVR
ncbi:MAG TPA: cyclic nucleotide-binding domain-containing protein [Pyrinomonadaceae bacterium]